MTDKEQKRIVADNINNLLNERQLSQKEVADAIGVSAQTFNTWCKGIAIPRMGKIQALADYFCVPKSQIIDKRIEDHGEKHVNNANYSTKENQLIQHYRQLNEEGQEKLTDYANDLVASGRYIKNNEFEMVDEKEAQIG